MTIDTSGLNAALKWLRTQTKTKTASEINNKNALKVAHQALKHTPSADAGKIAHVLGMVESEKVSRTKAGKVRRNKAGKILTKKNRYLKGDSFAARIINARRREKGEPMLFGIGAANAAQKLITARQKAKSFIKSGWLPSIQHLSAILGKKAANSRGGAAIRGNPKGFTVVTGGSNPTATISNAARGAVKVGQVALQKAIQDVTADIRKYGAPEIQRDMNKVSAKKSLNQQFREMGIKT